MHNDPFSLDKKFILITGASSGIGRQCAISCSYSGAKIILCGRNDERLKETQKLMHNQSQHIHLIMDVTDYDTIKDSIGQIVNKYGKLDGIVNCAGISTTLPLNSVSPTKMELYFHTNVIGAVNLSRIVTNPLNFSATGGSLVFISSIMGSIGENGKTLYSMTKGAITAAVKSMAVELARRKIRVNAISPGVVETPMSENAIYSRNAESLNKIKERHLLGLGKPEDVANAVIYLLSDASKWTTGTNMIVDGGYLSK